MKNSMLKTYAEIFLPGMVFALIHFIARADRENITVGVAAIVIFTPIFMLAAKGIAALFPNSKNQDRNIITIVNSSIIYGVFLAAGVSFFLLVDIGIPEQASVLLYRFALGFGLYVGTTCTFEIYLFYKENRKKRQDESSRLN